MIYKESRGFLWILKGSGARVLGSLCHPVMLCAAGLDPLYIKISDSGGLDLEAWMPGWWKDWNGLEEVTEGLEWMLDGRRGLEGRPTRSSFRSVADLTVVASAANPWNSKNVL